MNLIFSLILFLSKGFRKLSKILQEIVVKFANNSFFESQIVKSTSYNMVLSENESYYADQYWKTIKFYLKSMPANPKIIDLGCSQGRLTIKLAKYFSKGKLIGCDISKKAINYANDYMKQKKVKNIDFRNQTIKKCIVSFENSSVDIFVMTEVAFFYPEWRNDMNLIIDKLKPGGLLIMSFRSLYYYAMYLVKNSLYDQLDTIINKRDGHILNTASNFSWNTSHEIKELFTKKYNCEILQIIGIGSCSGIPGDPNENIAQPSKLFNNELKILDDIETFLGKDMPDTGRYMLAIANKKK